MSNNINIGSANGGTPTITIGSSNISFGTGTINTCIGGGGGGGAAHNIAYSWRDPNEGISEFVEFALMIMGVDLTFEEFKKMDGAEKKAFLRDIKIDKIIE